DLTLYASADPSGNISNNEFYTDWHDVGISFTLTATGMNSGLTAQTTFTDSAANLDQYANDPPVGWVNGNLGDSKSTYFEGDSIPYRMTFDGLTSGSHTVTIAWDTTQSGKHAIDYLTTWNRTVATADPCDGISGCGGTPSTFAIPQDPNVPFTQIAGNFTLFNGTITAVGVYHLASHSSSCDDSGSYSGDSTTCISITFTTSVSNPVLAWDGHIATRQNWGLDNSAVSISGSPYHMRLVDLDGTGGNQDRSLSAGAVIFPASITIIKDADVTGPTSFPFDGSPLPLSNFSLVDDGTSANTKLFSN